MIASLGVAGFGTFLSLVPQSIAASAASGDITTVVGAVATGPATSVPQNPIWVALASNRLLVSDGIIPVVRSIDLTTSSESALIGTGCSGSYGDGGPANRAGITRGSVAVGPDGSIYFADAGEHDVRRISPSGTISLFAGKPTNYGGYSGDGGPATQAELKGPEGIAVDSVGRVYIADHLNYVVRMVDTNGVITTVAGTGSAGDPSPDGVPATQASLGYPEGLAVDAADNLYIADVTGIREVSGGIITTVVPRMGGFPQGVAWANGILYFTDSYLQKAYQVVGGTVSVLAGNGTAGYAGDGGPARAAELNAPGGIAPDLAGNVYIADNANYRVRVVTGGTIRTLAGTGSLRTPDGGPAGSAQIHQAHKVAMDRQGGYYFTEEATHVVRHVDAAGRFTTAAGNGVQGFSGDGGPATSAELNNPVGLALAANGDLYIADQTNGRIRRVHNGVIDTFAGGGPPGSFGDGGPALQATFTGPQYLAFDAQGNLYIADAGGERIRKVDLNGMISTYAGGSGSNDPGDGGPATNAFIGRPGGIAFDTSGNLFITEPGYQSIIRRVDASTQIITTVAGKNNAPGYGGDRGPATSAFLDNPEDVEVDANGDLFIADEANHRIRVVIDGQIYTAFGNGEVGCRGDNGPASEAQIGTPQGVTLDGNGNLYIAQLTRIREVSDVAGWLRTNPTPRPTKPGNYHVVTPLRILDTRSGPGHVGALPGGQSFDLQITGQNGVPSSGVTAVVMNVTATNTTAGSYLTVYPAGQSRPVASNLNWKAGVTVPNLVQVPVGTDGSVTFFNAAGSVDVIADLAGYVSTDDNASGALRYMATPPNRILDTRKSGSHPLGPGQTMSVYMAAPQLKQYAVTVNVTATDATASSYLTLWPHGSSRPTASNLNFTAGQTIANRVTVGVDPSNTETSGYVDIYNAAGTVDVIVDVNGEFQEAASWPYGRFQGIPPVRVLDTRDGTGTGKVRPLGPGETLVLPVAGPTVVPSGVQAVVGNLTVTNTSSAGYLTAWPDGLQRPTASDLNWTAGATVPNMIVVQVSRDGVLDLYNPAGSTDVILDITGWYR